MSTYSDSLKDPRWQRKRLEILQRDDFTCVRCGEKEITLHVHHCLYRKGRKPWEYDHYELETVCEICHSIEHTKGLTQLETFLITCIQNRDYGKGQTAHLKKMIDFFIQDRV